jgi:hypothetical protein
VAAGATALEPSLRMLTAWVTRGAPDASEPVFCSAYGRVLWCAPLLQRLRAYTT